MRWNVEIREARGLDAPYPLGLHSEFDHQKINV